MSEFDRSSICGASPMDAWDVQRLHDAMQATEPDDVSFCASSMSLALKYSQETREAFREIDGGELTRFSARLNQVPGSEMVATAVAGFALLGEHAVQVREERTDAQGVQSAFFSEVAAVRPGVDTARIVHQLDSADVARLVAGSICKKDDVWRRGEVVSFIEQVAFDKAQEPDVLLHMGERANPFGDSPRPDPALNAVAHAFIHFDSDHNRAELRGHFSDAAEFVASQKLWPAVIGSLAVNTEPAPDTRFQPASRYGSFIPIANLASVAYLNGDDAAVESVAAALEEVGSALPTQQPGVCTTDKTAGQPDLLLLDTMSYLLRHRNDAPSHAPKKDLAALRSELKVVREFADAWGNGAGTSEQRHSLDPLAARALRSVLALSADGALLDKAVALMFPHALGRVVEAAIGYDEQTQQIDFPAGSRKQPAKLYELVKALHRAATEQADSAMVPVLAAIDDGIDEHNAKLADHNFIDRIAPMPLMELSTVLLGRAEASGESDAIEEKTSL